MLQSLHVKNLALIQETEVEFTKGLNILTGETGAGKSLLLGSINLALGAKFDSKMLRKGTDNGLVELVFVDDSENVKENLNALDISPIDDGTIIISRKLSAAKSTFKINGETVTAKQVKELATSLLDIHGQHEHQSLLNKKKHLEILDYFCGEELTSILSDISIKYNKLKELRKSLEGQDLDDASKRREQSLAEFELNEIEASNLQPGEDEELENAYRKMVNSKKLTEGLGECYHFTGSDSEYGAAGTISRALRAISQVSGYDEGLKSLEAQLIDIDSLISDFNRDISSYLSDLEFSEEDFASTEERLNLINRLKDKYGKSYEEIMNYAEEKRQLLEKLMDFDAYIAGLNAEIESCEKELLVLCGKASEIRKKQAAILTGKLIEAMEGLNFNTVKFNIEVRDNQTPTAHGYDDVEFLISTNPGEDMAPLANVASGGELSRIMLAIKTVLASSDTIDTMIFDEIDTGISGKTAWKVSQKLGQLAREAQVICITHLPQIAAMADTHFKIEKSSTEDSTITDICKVTSEESTKELARLLGSDELTDAALENARQMQAQALEFKRQ